ncbi:hypothetical protein D3C76_967890 [compost metagenome]
MADQFRGFEVGQQVWIKSLNDTGVVAGWIESRGEILVIGPFDSHTAVGYFTNQIEPLARDAFPVGTRVETPHYFKGVVTGYEDDTNRVVCYSDKTNEYNDNIDPGDADRIRYSYSVRGIRKIEEIQLAVGQHYVLTTHRGNGTNVLVTYHPTQKNTLMLVDVFGGSILAMFDKNKVSQRDLKSKQIASLVRMEPAIINFS